MGKGECVIVVRYEFDADLFVKKMRGISSDYRVYVYDNSASVLDFSGENIYYISDPLNGGLAVGLNCCIDAAVRDGMRRAVYFDQDSELSIGIVGDLFSSYDRLKSFDGAVFAVGPQPIMHDGREYPVRTVGSLGGGCFRATEIITSGMTFDLCDVKEIGGFDEDLFLDLVDFELCWRATRAGMMVVVDKNIKMPHEVGVNTIRLPFKILPISSPVRNYYQIRNIIYVLIYKERKSYFVVTYYLFRKLANIFFNICFADRKRERISYNLLGVRDAFMNRMGKLKG